jgi:chorismate mutase/prephenate dehydratase
MVLPDKKLKSTRQKIDQLDSQIVELLAKRFQFAKEAGEIKKASRKDLQDLAREQSLLSALTERAEKKGLDPVLISKLYRIILEHSVSVQEPTDHCRVAYQGQEGAFSTLAAKRFFKSQKQKLHLLGYETFAETLYALENNRVQYAILPVENKITGAIPEVCDLLAKSNFKTIGEINQPVEHCLIGLPKASIKNITRVISHPQALKQCSQFIASLTTAKAENYTDTAMAVQKVLKDADFSQAAIASKEAAQIHGLKILKRHIANQTDNSTRFAILALNK